MLKQADEALVKGTPISEATRSLGGSSNFRQDAAMVRVQYRPLMSQACTRKGLHRDAQPCLSPGPAAFAEGCCMLVRVRAAS
jgi:hypothetical protein